MPHLGEAQGKTLWTELAAAREFARDEGYWFPFTDSGRKDVVAIQAPYFRRVASDSVLIAALRARSIDRVIEFREGGGTYELTVEDLDPKNTGEEGYWSAPPWDWVLYASHESLITVGGQWLIEVVQSAWP